MRSLGVSAHDSGLEPKRAKKTIRFDNVFKQAPVLGYANKRLTRSLKKVNMSKAIESYIFTITYPLNCTDRPRDLGHEALVYNTMEHPLEACKLFANHILLHKDANECNHILTICLESKRPVKRFYSKEVIGQKNFLRFCQQEFR